MSRHIEDAAELYALGALEPDEAAQVEAHLASGCDDCARRVGRAERMVAEMEAAHVPQVAPPPELGRRLALAPLGASAPRPRTQPAWFAALAAAVLIALIGFGALARHLAVLQATIARNDLVFATMTHTHFRHAQFVDRAASGLVAKAIYAPSGAWLYVIVDAADCGCRVVVQTAAGPRDLGPPQPEGQTSTLFVPAAAKPAGLALVRDADGATLATVHLVY